MRAGAIAIAAVLGGCHPTPLTPAPLPPLVSTPVPARAPAPAPAAPRADDDVKIAVEGDVTDAWVRGIHVLVQRNPGAETVATGLYIAGGAMTWTKATAGLEELALAVATTGGTAQLDKDAFSRRLVDLGSSIGSVANEDFSAITAWSLAPAWDATFALLVASFRTPALPATQLEVERGRQLADLQHELDDPDARLGLVVDRGIFAGHPYEKRAEGTLETVGAFTPAQVAAQLATLRETSRLLVVVVGDIDPRHVIDAVGTALGDLPRGSYTPHPVPELAAPAAGTLEITADKLPTNYIEAVVPGPRWTDPDFAVARVAMAWLAQREFEEVRTKRNLSYAPEAGFSWATAVPFAYLYVTAVDPRTTMKVMLDEATRLGSVKMAEHDLRSTKAMLLTRMFLDGEAPADQAALLADAQLHGGDWHLIRTLTDRVNAVTVDQVQAWAARSLTHFRTFVIGDGSKLDRAALERF